jgi:hypothetical protein
MSMLILSLYAWKHDGCATLDQPIIENRFLKDRLHILEKLRLPVRVSGR